MPVIKEVARSAAIAWSPLVHQPSWFAAGSLAGSMSLDFDPTGSLEIFSTNHSNAGPDVALAGKVQIAERLHRLSWTTHPSFVDGLLVGGHTNGTVSVWDPSAIIQGESDGLVASAASHSGPVYSLDFNPFQSHLMCSGGAGAEVFIWDMSTANAPSVYTPGAMNQNISSDITSVAWNRKVIHVLATATYSGTTIIWDLRAKRPAVTFADPSRRNKCKAIAWSPEQPTIIATSSEEDENPVVQLWDLTNAFAPVKTLHGHSRGVLSLSWCPFDSNLLLSSGKDGRSLCWDVTTGEVLSELEPSSNWNVDARWSPILPTLAATSSLDGKVRIHSVQDFDAKVAGPDGEPLAATASTLPSRAPQWISRKPGASFAFGGKLVRAHGTKATVDLVVTEKELVNRVQKLESAVLHSRYKEFCEEKLRLAKNDDDRATWAFVSILSQKKPRAELLKHLGFDQETLEKRLHEFIDSLPVPPGLEVIKGGQARQSNGSADPKPKDVSSLFEGSSEMSFDFGQAPPSDMPPKNEAASNGVVESAPLFITNSALKTVEFTSPDKIESAVLQSLVAGDFAAGVECCLRVGRYADALVLAACGGNDLWRKTRDAFFQLQEKESPSIALLSRIATRSYEDLVKKAELSSWRECLAVLCSYASTEQFQQLSEVLGDRLKSEKKDMHSATLCYLCAGSVHKTVATWFGRSLDARISLPHLQELIERAVLFGHAVGTESIDETLVKKYYEYASILASQGRLVTALHFLRSASRVTTENPSHPWAKEVAALLDRVYRAASRKSQSTYDNGKNRIPVQSAQAEVAPRNPVQSPPSRKAHVGNPVSPPVQTSTVAAPGATTAKKTGNGKKKTKKSAAAKPASGPREPPAIVPVSAPPGPALPPAPSSASPLVFAPVATPFTPAPVFAAPQALGPQLPAPSAVARPSSATPPLVQPIAQPVSATKKKVKKPMPAVPASPVVPSFTPPLPTGGQFNHVPAPSMAPAPSPIPVAQPPAVSGRTRAPAPSAMPSFSVPTFQQPPPVGPMQSGGNMYPPAPTAMAPAPSSLPPLPGRATYLPTAPSPVAGFPAQPTSGAPPTVYNPMMMSSTPVAATIAPPPAAAAPPPRPGRSSKKSEHGADAQPSGLNQQELGNNIQEILQRLRDAGDSTADDVANRLQELLDKLQAGSFAPLEATALSRLVNSLLTAAHKEAKEAHTELTTSHYHAIGSKAMLGLKRLLASCEKYGL